uniref:Uncharacterized protein n=1 Tax=Meloidogyne hapla TaxID=6305 RepID=A0A1I8B6R4_MELHA
MTESPTSTNSFIDGDSQFNQNNCLKRKRTLEGELDRTSMEMKLIKEKFDLQNSLMEQLDENKKIVGANNKLSEELEKSTIGNEMLKKENDKNLEELAKIKKKCSDLIDDKSKAMLQ